MFSGVLVALAFPTVVDGFRFPDLSFLIWVGFVPLLVAIRHRSYASAARSVFVAGVVSNGLVSYWILYALIHFGEIHPLPSLGALLLMGALLGGMLTALVLLALWGERRLRLPWLVLLPLACVLFEWLRNYVPLGGYPWSNPAYALGSYDALIQTADLFGVYGLDFLVVLVNATLAEIIAPAGSDFLALIRARSCLHGLWKARGAGLVCLLLLVAATLYGHWRLGQLRAVLSEAPQLTVGLVQPNIPQEFKWDARYADAHLEILKRLTGLVLARGAEFVIWPESAYVDPLPVSLQTLIELDDWDRPLLTGAVTVVPSRSRTARRRYQIYNSALLVQPGGRITTHYHKNHLVPLGEYVPLQSVFGFLDKVVPAVGDFLPGTKQVVFTDLPSSFGVTICYEDLFPELNRSLTLSGADYLVNLTNDAWYGHSSALYQHLEFSRFRAIENRRSVVRSTNNGITAVIDPTGRILATLPVNIETETVVPVPIYTGALTYYSRYGDIPLFCLLAGLLLYTLLARYVFRSRRTPG